MLLLLFTLSTVSQNTENSHVTVQTTTAVEVSTLISKYSMLLFWKKVRLMPASVDVGNSLMIHIGCICVVLLNK